MEGSNGLINFKSTTASSYASPVCIQHSDAFVGLTTSANVGGSASNIKFGIKSGQNQYMGMKNGAGYLALSGGGNVETGGNYL